MQCFLVHASASLHQQARKCTVVFQPPWLLCPGDVAVGAFFALLLLLNRPEGAEPIFVCVRGLLHHTCQTGALSWWNFYYGVCVASMLGGLQLSNHLSL